MPLALLLAASVATTESMPVPGEVQIPLLLKVLTYDRNFQLKAIRGLKVGIVYSSKDKESVKARDEIVKAFAAFSGTVKQTTMTTVPIDFVDAAAFEKAVKSTEVNVFYLCPGTAASIEAITKLSHVARITTITGVPSYVEKGIAIGIDVKTGKPQILINLPNSKSEGSQFDASLLRIAAIVGK